MALVRVSGNVHLNTACVGKTDHNRVFTDTSRTSTTTVFDVTGQHKLFEYVSTVNTERDNPDKDAVKRDNHAHEEIVAAIREVRDANPFPDPNLNA